MLTIQLSNGQITKIYDYQIKSGFLLPECLHLLFEEQLFYHVLYLDVLLDGVCDPLAEQAHLLLGHMAASLEQNKGLLLSQPLLLEVKVVTLEALDPLKQGLVGEEEASLLDGDEIVSLSQCIGCWRFLVQLIIDLLNQWESIPLLNSLSILDIIFSGAKLSKMFYVLTAVMIGCGWFVIYCDLFDDKGAIGCGFVPGVESADALAGAEDFGARRRAGYLSSIALHESLELHRITD